jgi:hypothetical protein
VQCTCLSSWHLSSWVRRAQQERDRARRLCEEQLLLRVKSSRVRPRASPPLSPLLAAAAALLRQRRAGQLCVCVLCACIALNARDAELRAAPEADLRHTHCILLRVSTYIYIVYHMHISLIRSASMSLCVCMHGSQWGTSLNVRDAEFRAALEADRRTPVVYTTMYTSLIFLHDVYTCVYSCAQTRCVRLLSRACVRAALTAQDAEFRAALEADRRAAEDRDREREEAQRAEEQAAQQVNVHC